MNRWRYPLDDLYMRQSRAVLRLSPDIARSSINRPIDPLRTSGTGMNCFLDSFQGHYSQSVFLLRVLKVTQFCGSLDGCFWMILNRFGMLRQLFWLWIFCATMKRPAQAPKRKAVKTRPKPKQKVAKEKVATQKKVGKQQVVAKQPVAKQKVSKDKTEKKRKTKTPVEGRLMTEAGQRGVVGVVISSACIWVWNYDSMIPMIGVTATACKTLQALAEEHSINNAGFGRKKGLRQDTAVRLMTHFMLSPFIFKHWMTHTLCAFEWRVHRVRFMATVDCGTPKLHLYEMPRRLLLVCADLTCSNFWSQSRFGTNPPFVSISRHVMAVPSSKREMAKAEMQQRLLMLKCERACASCYMGYFAAYLTRHSGV